MFWSEAALITTSGLLVLTAAGPVGLLARALRPRGEPLLPRWKPWPVPWNGFAVTVAFVVSAALLPGWVLELLTRSGFFQSVYGPDFPVPGAPDVTPPALDEVRPVRMVWAGLFALPVLLGLLWGAAMLLYPNRTIAIVGTGSLAGKVALAVLAWLVIAPAVLVFHAAVNAVAQQFEVTPEQHTLTTFGKRPAFDQVLFLLEACVGAPVREEVIFRGLLLAWCAGRIKFPGAGVDPVTGARPWFVMAAAIALAVLIGNGRAGPIVFAGVLAVGLGVLWRFQRTGARRARAVYATAALFAVVHAGVWPSPVPLFLLGLGLGWLAVRTNGVLVPVIVHGLFNAVSAVYVLRA